MEPIETSFRRLPIHCFSQLKSLHDFNNYVDGLVLIDDLLCRYDSVPRNPQFSRSYNNGISVSVVSPLQQSFNDCLEAIELTEIKKNLKTNYSTAEYLLENRVDHRTEVHVFLAEVLKLYSELTHPAIYPDKLNL